MKIETPQLALGEQMIAETKGDTWEKPDYLWKSQVRGKFFFTNQRMLFRTWGPKKEKVAYELAYSDIASVKKYRINFFIPTGIKITTKGGGVYRISVMKRKNFIAILEEHIS